MKVTRNDRQAKVRICPDCESREVDKYCTYCSECAVIRQQEFHDIANFNKEKNREKNREKNNEYMRNYRKDHKEQMNKTSKESAKRYYYNNRESVLEKAKLKYKQKKLNEETVW